MSFDAVIIGGGLSGLSAAVDLAHSGMSVALIEQKPFLGGRTYSFTDPTTGDEVDNGQHLLMGCYTETRRYLSRIGSDHLASLQPTLRIPFLHPSKGRAVLSCPRIPSPFHVQVGLLGLSTLPFSQRVGLLRVGMQLPGNRIEKHASKLDAMSVTEWLRELGQGDEARKYLWDVIAIGSLNEDPARVSALLFARVLRAAFLGEREHSSLLIPRVGLSRLLVDPAARYLAAGRHRVITGKRIHRIEMNEGRAAAVHCDDGSTIEGSAFLSAVPPLGLKKILAASSLELESVSEFIGMLTSSPIISITLWLDRKILDDSFVAVLDCHIQWIFNRTQILIDGTNANKSSQCLSIVLSAASSYTNLDQDELVAIALEDLRKVIPGANEVRVLHALVIKERRATFTPRPGLDHRRPGAVSAVPNLFLAGDWTGTGYPATIEGAVISGHRAAQAIRGMSGR